MNKNVLLIEDDPSTMEVYKIALEQAGFVVDTADSGEDALEKIKEDGHDLILLDYILPGVDGGVVLREIRKNPKTKKIKVLIITNYSKEALESKGKFIAGEKFVIKADYPPMKMIELIKKELED